jgi:hypothetical protein
MINLKSEGKEQLRRHRVRWLILLLLVPVVGLVEERLRGQSGLKSWKQEMTVGGEVFDAAQLWPPVSAKSVEFSEQLKQATQQLAGRLGAYSGGISAIILDASGQISCGSKAPGPVRSVNHQMVAMDPTYTWQDLDKLLQQSQPALERLRELMKDPPTGINYDILKRQQEDSMPNFVAYRIAAQALHASAINHLHKGNLQDATRDLEAILAFGKAGDQDPTLVSLMIRSAILGLSIDVCWDALQAEGWTEPQMVTLQQHCLNVTNVLTQLPRTLEAERIARTYELHWFRSHTDAEWLARYRDRYAGRGWKLPDTDHLWRQGLFDPVWRLPWAGEKEELEYLQAMQRELTVLREVPHTLSYVRLNEEITASRQGHHTANAAWRFYTRLPLADDFNDFIRDGQPRDASYPYPDYSRAWLVVIKNLTLHEMVVTAIAIKRYELKNGTAPADLAALVPEFLPAVPPDLMDGRPLRYRLEPGHGYTLYSVGEDGQDDGGSMVPSSGNSDYRPVWDGKDLVWPHVATGAKTAPIANYMQRPTLK